jgi:hypothetical protein
MSQIGTIYLTHFSHRIGGEGRNGAQHYAGWAAPGKLDARIVEHRNGNGARILAFVMRSGFDFEVVATWDGTRDDERRFKRVGHFDRRCPICKAGRIIAASVEGVTAVVLP